LEIWFSLSIWRKSALLCLSPLLLLFIKLFFQCSLLCSLRKQPINQRCFTFSRYWLILSSARFHLWDFLVLSCFWYKCRTLHETGIQALVSNAGGVPVFDRSLIVYNFTLTEHGSVGGASVHFRGCDGISTVAEVSWKVDDARFTFFFFLNNSTDSWRHISWNGLWGRWLIHERLLALFSRCFMYSSSFLAYTHVCLFWLIYLSLSST